jgi:hypothetical protein
MRDDAGRKLDVYIVAATLSRSRSNNRRPIGLMDTVGWKTEFNPGNNARLRLGDLEHSPYFAEGSANAR